MATVEQTASGATITIRDASGTTTATVTNGKDGKDGVDGQDGYTPQKGIDYFDGQPGKDGEDGKDGYTPVKGVDYFDGSPGKDGKDGNPGADGYTPVKGKDYFDGKDGSPGADGSDGITPHIGSNGNWYIGNTDTGKPSRGADGQDGKDGQPGKDGNPGKDGTSATHSWNGTVLTITSASGTSSADLKGAKGDKGDTGATGATGPKPVKGVDYWAPADQEDIVQQVITALGTPVFGRVEQGNKITLSTEHLADGTYYFGYEDKDGNWVEIGTYKKGKVPETYSEWLPGIKLSKTDNTYETLAYDPMKYPESYAASDHIPVDHTATYKFVAGAGPKRTISICEYDSTGNLIKYQADVLAVEAGQDAECGITLNSSTTTFRVRMFVAYHGGYTIDDVKNTSHIIKSYPV